MVLTQYIYVVGISACVTLSDRSTEQGKIYNH